MATRAEAGPPAVGADSTRARIIVAAIRQCEEIGLRRLTMEDVARRAGLGRATLYRHFPSKDALVQAAVLAEAEAFFAALDGAIADCRSDEDRLVEGFAFALEYTRGHALLQKLLRTEPETLLPYLIGGGQLIQAATEAVRRRIHETSPSTRMGAATAELLVRLVLSLALTPDSGLGIDDRRGALRLARRYLVPRVSARP
jgi:AcrR family transcriptional regulator